MQVMKKMVASELIQQFKMLAEAQATCNHEDELKRYASAAKSYLDELHLFGE